MLALATASILLVAAAIPRVLGRKAMQAGRERSRFEGLVTAMVQEMLAAHRIVRAFALEDGRRRLLAAEQTTKWAYRHLADSRYVIHQIVPASVDCPHSR